MTPTILAAAAAGKCSTSAPSGVGTACTVLGVLAMAAVVRIAGAYPIVDTPRNRWADKLLTLPGLIVALIALIGQAGVNQAHHDCAARIPAWPGEVMFGALLAVMIGIIAKTGSTWAPILLVGIFDLLAATAYLVSSTASNKTEFLILLCTHSVSCLATGWWSWRCRGASKADRAQVSEAGRVLVGAWLIVVLAEIASRNVRDDPPLTVSTFVAVFLVAAITLTVGAGYTRYVAIHEALAGSTPPQAGGWPGQLRDVAVHLWSRLTRRPPPTVKGSASWLTTWESTWL